jgi:hypothetical protein
VAMSKNTGTQLDLSASVILASKEYWQKPCIRSKLKAGNRAATARNGLPVTL